MDGLQPVTPGGTAISDLFWLVLGISALVLLLVAGVLVYCLLRFRARPGDEEPPQTHGNRTLEIIWTATPVLVLTGLFVLTLHVMGTVEAAPPSPLRIQVIGSDWWWEFRYPDLGVVTANEVHVPVGTPVLFEITASDVIHSFWVPRIGWKKDAIPGKINQISTRVDEPGTYHGACSEFCGLEHAWMRIVAVAEPRAQFDAWVARQLQPGAAPAGALATRGQQVFLQRTCVNCHTVAGTTAQGQVGPNLTHLGSRSIIGAGVLPNTPDNLRHFVEQVQSVKPGARMPNYADLTSDDLDALVAYLEGLQ